MILAQVTDMKRTHIAISCLSLALFLGACSEDKPATQAPKEPEKPAEAVSAQSAFQKMYVMARAWAPDAQPIRMASIDLKQPKSEAGKAGAWECTFVTDRRNRSRRYTFAVVAVPESNLQKGVFASSEDTWSSGGQAKPFPIQSFKTDSVKAYEVAAAKSADYMKKHPDMPVKFLLEWTKRFPGPVWRVIWGESIALSSYSVFVDASTGDFKQIAR